MTVLQYNYFKKFLLITALFSFANLSRAQDEKADKTDKQAEINRLVGDHRYVFKAQSAHPARGRTIQLDSGYDLAISKDTIKSYLPYFGRAYSAPMDGRGGGFDFISKDFEYIQKDRGKGRWEITIKPKDANDIREMFLTIFGNGSASLRVFSNNRESISFNGYITEKNQ